MDIELPQDFKEFLSILNSHEVDYLLIGGYAVGYYGYPRATNDMDIWVSIDSENAKKMVNVLHDFGLSTPDLSTDLFLEKGNIVRLGIPPMRIEILNQISGVLFEECFSKRVIDEIDGIQINFISLERLKANKKASGRFKDLDDLENLPPK